MSAGTSSFHDDQGDQAGRNENAPCAECGSTLIETTGAARRGGGYHRRCENGHEWDDPKWSYFKAGM